LGLHWIASWVAGISLLFQQLVYSPDRFEVTLQGQNLATIERSEYHLPFPGLPLVNDVKLFELLDKLDKQVYREPVNASLDGGGAIIEEQTGYRFDRNAFTDQFYKFMIEGNMSSLEAPKRFLYPKVDSELLASIREKMIGQYTTYFNSNNKNRSHNIVLAAKAINNQVVFPGETFSFNQIVGIRTAERGYLQAKVIVRGEISEGIGGGICQISSTLFNAVDRAGLKIVQRYSHSRSVPYVPPGRDATVSWYGPDFVFQNEYNQPILIRTFVQGGQASIALYSSDSVNVKNRNVPSASKQLPQEIVAEQDNKTSE